MGRIVIVVYRPKKGKEEELVQLVKEHVPILRNQGLVTDRPPVIMKAADGCVVEVFEWTSSDAITQAHQNKVVRELWARFDQVCTYESPGNVDEFQRVFSEFDGIE